MTHPSLTHGSSIWILTTCMVVVCQKHFRLANFHSWRSTARNWKFRRNVYSRGCRHGLHSQVPYDVPRKLYTNSAMIMGRLQSIWRLTVGTDMLSEYTIYMLDKNWKPVQKVTPTMNDNTKCVCHYRNLQCHFCHGLILNKIHRVTSFEQKPWLKSWISLHNIHLHHMARDVFESDLAKLQTNATSGKP